MNGRFNHTQEYAARCCMSVQPNKYDFEKFMRKIKSKAPLAVRVWGFSAFTAEPEIEMYRIVSHFTLRSIRINVNTALKITL